MSCNEHMQGQVKRQANRGNPRTLAEEQPAKSLRFNRGTPGVCRNPFCRSRFRPERKDHRFCCRKCKEVFFKVRYGLLVLAPYFDLVLQIAKQENTK